MSWNAGTGRARHRAWSRQAHPGPKLVSLAPVTPLWVPLAVAVAGLIGTVGGVWLNQRRADQREQANWNRERAWERERWDREDAARTFDHRRDAYSVFYASVCEMGLRAYNQGTGLRDEEELYEWQPTFQKLQHLRLYATASIAKAATATYAAASQWARHTTFGQDDDQFQELRAKYDAADAELLALIRADLSIPDD